MLILRIIGLDIYVAKNRAFYVVKTIGSAILKYFPSADSACVNFVTLPMTAIGKLKSIAVWLVWVVDSHSKIKMHSHLNIEKLYHYNKKNNSYKYL